MLIINQNFFDSSSIYQYLLFELENGTKMTPNETSFVLIRVIFYLFLNKTKHLKSFGGTLLKSPRAVAFCCLSFAYFLYSSTGVWQSKMADC